MPRPKVLPLRLLRLLATLSLFAWTQSPAAAQRRTPAATGVVVTGDQFIADRAKGQALREWKSAFELAFGEGSPYAAKFPSLYELPYDVNLSITKEVLDRVVAVALSEAGGRRLSLAYLPGGFETFPVVPSAQLDTRATDAQTLAALNVIGYLAQQTLVIASRREPFGNRAALQITQTAGSDLAAHANAQRFWQRLSGLEPKLNPGFSGTLASGRPGLFVIDTEGDWLTWDDEKFDAAAAAVSKELDVTTAVEHFRVEYVSAGNDWKKHPKGEEYLKRLRESGKAALAARLESLWRPRVERWIAAAFASRGVRGGARPQTLTAEPATRPPAPTPRPTIRSRPQLIP